MRTRAAGTQDWLAAVRMDHPDRLLFEAYRVRVMHEGTTGYDLVTFSHPGGAVVVPRPAFRGNTFFGFVTQFRHATLTDTLEFPRGMAEAGETLLECAVREMREETGHRVSEDRGIDLGAIANGKINCALTLAAWAKVTARHLDRML